MNFLDELSKTFIGPTLLQLEFRRDIDGSFRKWSQESNICCVIALDCHAEHYALNVGFCSPTIANWFGLKIDKEVTIAQCNTCGILLGSEMLDSSKVHHGWLIGNPRELAEIGKLFRSWLESNLPEWLQSYMTFDGWSNHFREKLKNQIAGRGLLWSMLGYSLLASADCTVDSIQQVLRSHFAEDPSRKLQNRNSRHLEIQRELVLERFGAKM